MINFENCGILSCHRNSRFETVDLEVGVALLRETRVRAPHKWLVLHQVLTKSNPGRLLPDLILMVNRRFV